MRRLCTLSVVALLSSLLLVLPAAGRVRAASFERGTIATSSANRPMIHVPTPPGLRVQSGSAVNTTSLNWCGYAAATDLTTGVANTVSDAVGTWVVPTITGGTVDAYSVDWVGIDGFQINSPSVEQLGTEADWIGGVPQYSAWWEMYPGPSQPIPSMAIHPGDVMAAQVHWVSADTFTLSLTDVTTSATFSTQQALGSTAVRTCAEWVHEAPQVNGLIAPLTHTTPVTFSACSATVNGAAGGIGDSRWQNAGIDMVQGNTVLAQASALGAGGTSFVVGLPHISASSASLTFDHLLGGATPAAQSLTFTNPGGGTLNWSASSDTPAWLSCTPNSGGPGGSTTVSVDPSLLDLGTYTGRIVVTVAGADNSPLMVPVTLHVTLTPPVVVTPVPGKVTINKPGSVKAKRAFGLSGYVYPHGGTVRVLRYVASRGKWKRQGSYSAKVAGARWKVTVNTTSKGRWKFVAQFVGDSTHTPGSAACLVTAK